jgi:predicted Zn finger-like uncharacterized protein
MQIQCDHCHASYEVSEGYLGKRVKCSKCQQPFLVQMKEGLSSAKTEGQTEATRRAAVESPIPAPASAVTKSKQHTNQEQDRQQWSIAKRREEVMSGFRGKFQRPRTSFSYRLGMTAAMGAMLLLPLLYACFVAAIAWLVWLHLANNWVLIQYARGRGLLVAVMLYVAPAVAGAIAIVFMFKPLLARPAKQGRIRSLTPQGEPVLFEFVKRICDEVGAPIPKRIDINNEVNASASFRAGWWSIVRGNDLVLTLGMPLLSGLTLQQLAGVIAHEFGHFSQGAGMRVSYVLRTISHWFVRAVYERDSWDEWLESMSQEADGRFSWLFSFARLAVWLSRRFLWVLMYIGYLLTGIIQKQMEYDADRYEVGMAGKLAFASTFRSLRTAAIGYEQAMGTLGRIASEGRVVADLPKLATVHAHNLPQDKLNEFLDKSMKEKANFFDSHPCDNDRIAAAANAPDQGVFQSELPASALMQNFEAACMGVTKDDYEKAFGQKLAKLKVVPTESVVEEQSREDAGWESLGRFFMEAIAPTREFPLPHYQVFQPSDSQQAAKLITKARQTMAQAIDHYCSYMQLQDQAYEQQQAQDYVNRLQRKISKVDTSGASQKNEQQLTIANPDPALAMKFPKACGIRLHTCCCLLKDPTIASRVTQASELLHDAISVLPTLHALDVQLLPMRDLEKRFGYLVFCFGHLEKVKGDQSALVTEIMDVSKNLVGTYSEFRRTLLGIPYPFEHADASVTVGQFLTTEILVAEEVGNVVEACSSLISGFYNLRGRCLGKLVLAAESVEAALGLPLLERPQPAT